MAVKRKNAPYTEERKARKSADMLVTLAKRGRISKRQPHMSAACRDCKKVLLPTAFRLRKVGPHSYLRAQCRKCEHIDPKSVAGVRRRQKNNPQRVRDAGARTRARHPEVMKIYNNEMPKLRAGIDGAVRADQWFAVRAFFGNCCAYCGGNKRMTIDHVVPLSRGGEHDITNIVPACQSCNSAKGCRFMSEWVIIPPERRVVSHG